MTGVPFQQFTCQRCRNPVQVLQLPTPYLDPKTYVCGRCRDPRQPTEIVPYNQFPKDF
jgi:hypothetical protein